MNHIDKDTVMEHVPDTQQVHAVFEFMMFLGDTLGRTSQQFEEETLCSPEEANVLQTLTRRGPLMIKEIAQTIPGMSLSKLTRVLDSLETQGYITRTLNRQDRRSFLVAPTEQGTLVVGRFTHALEELAQRMLTALTPTERLVLVELFAKIRANWSEITDQ
jgi:DNA-binding MarR family transcriptional regulator